MDCLPQPQIYRWTIAAADLAAIGDEAVTWPTYQIELLEGRVEQVDATIVADGSGSLLMQTIFIYGDSSRSTGPLGPHLLWAHTPDCLTRLPAWYRPGAPMVSSPGLRASCLLGHPPLPIRTWALWTSHRTTDLNIALRVWVTR